jgi:ubiquinone biosynthesis protein UbiJ
LIGNRVADAGRALLELPEHAARSFGTSLTGYVHDEAGLGVDTGRFADFSTEVAAISARVDALATRLDQVAEVRSTKAKPR